MCGGVQEAPPPDGNARNLVKQLAKRAPIPLVGGTGLAQNEAILPAKRKRKRRPGSLPDLPGLPSLPDLPRP